MGAALSEGFDTAKLQHAPFVGLLAAHLQPNADSERLCYCLLSIARQTRPLALFALGVSQAGDAVGFDVEDFVRSALATTSTRVVVSSSPRRCSQFEHYKRVHHVLRADAENKVLLKTAWVLFSDADDLWNSRRVECYSRHVCGCVCESVV